MPRNVKTPLFAAIVCAAAVVPLGVAAHDVGSLARLDLRLLVHFEREAGTVERICEVLVNLGGLAALLVMLAAICAIGLRFRRRREAVAAVVVVVGANLTTQLLKATLEHARDRAWTHGIELPLANSYPSGHTTAAASIAVALLLVVPAAHRLTAALAAAALAASVGASVVVLDWHYPSDVLGGLLVVATWGFLALAALRFRAARDAARARRDSPPRSAASPRHGAHAVPTE